jgi:nitrate reductase NapE component
MKKYIDDYEVVIQENSKGRKKRVAVYKGAWYEININESALKKFRRNSLILMALVVIGLIGAGFIGNQGMYSFFVSLPYVLAFLPLYFLVDGGLRLPKEKRNFRHDEVDLIFTRIRVASHFLFPILCVGIIGEVVYLIWFSTEAIWLDILFLVVEVLVTAAAFALFRTQRPIEVTQIFSEQVSIEEDGPINNEEPAL